MRFSRRALLIGRLCCAWGLWIGATLAAEEVRVAVSDGHVAVQTAAGASWTLLAAGDVVPDAADFRTSAAGAVTIPAAGDVITIGPESWGRWDHSQRSLAIERGRVLIAVGSDNAWSITAHGVRFAAPQSSTISVAADGDHIACDVLRGEVQISGDALESGHFAAPAAIAIRAGKTEVSVPNDRNWATAAVAWAQLQPRQGPGQLLAREPDSNVTRRLKIARYHVNVVLQPPVALVQIDQSFYNPQDWGQAEGTFVFNLPHQASVSRFAMFVTHEDLIEGELIERSRADQVYTSIVHRRRDPAILEQIGDNLFRMRVFPIPARDTKRILLDYTVPLQAENGQYRFVLPLMSDLEPIWELKLTGTIHPPLDMATVASPSHADLKFTPAEDGTVHFEQRQEQVQPPPAFLLGYRGPTDPAPHVRSFTATSPGSSLRLMHFVATIPAWESTHATADQRPLDVQIVADTSSSAGDMQLMRQAVRTVVAGLRETDRFQLGCADASYRPLTQEWLAPRSAEAAQAFSALDAQLPLGSSQIWESLQTVFRSPPAGREGRQRLVVYVGDGISTDNPPLGEWSAPMLDNQTQFAAIRIGRTAEKAVFLQRLVELTGGMLFPVGEAPSELGQVFGWLLAGAPAPQRVESVAVSSAAEAAARDVHFPAVWPHGRPLEITGRTLGAEQLKLRVKLAKEDTAREYELQVPKHEKDEDVFVGRYWAEQQLDRMLQESPQRLWQRGESQERVVALAQEWSLMCPLTAFLVLEKESDYAQWHIDRNVRHRYWKPAGTLTSLPLPPEMRPNSLTAANAQAITSGTAEATGTVRDQAARRALTRGRQQAAISNQQRFDAALKGAETALQRNEPAQALVELVQVQPLAQTLGADRFNDLWNRAQAGAAGKQFLDGLTLQRPLLDRHTLPALPTVDPLLVSLQFGGMSPEYKQFFPYAEKLGRRVAPPADRMSLKAFAAFVAEHSGMNVILDSPELSAAGITGDEKLDLHGLREITLHGLARVILEDVNDVELAMVPEGSLLRITTKDVADNHLVTLVYPVADVVRTDLLPSPQWFSDPFRDMDRAMHERVRAKLERPISVSFKQTPLNDVVAYFRVLLQENLRFDRPELAGAGITGEERITLALNDIPGKTVLDEILRRVNDIELGYQIKDEVLTITTKEVADNTLDLRLYSLAGILYEVPEELIPRPQPGMWGWGMGMGGGFGGLGGGMGMGGMGGGFGGFGGGGMGMGGMGGGGGGFGGFGGGGFGGAGTGAGWIGGGGGSDGVAATSDSSVGPVGTSVSETGPVVTDKGSDANQVTAQAPTAETPTTQSATPTELLPAGDEPTEVVLQSKGGGGTGANYQAEINVLLNDTEGPWESIDGVGGPDPIPYRQSLSLFVRQTRRVHDEVAATLDRLRRLPPAGPLVRRARIPRITQNEPRGWKTNEIINCILNLTEGPWESIDGVGGPDPIPHQPSMSLVIRQTPRVHEEIYSLLADMRRSRVTAGRSTTAMRLSGVDDLARLRENLRLTDLPETPRRDGLPAVDQEELLLLERARRESIHGRQTWMHTRGAGGGRRVTLVVADSRLQLELSDHMLRADADQAAVAYPGVTLVELGAWGESVRRIADARFPWLLHRTNQELSQLFDIAMEQADAEGVMLRLGFPGTRAAYLLQRFTTAGQLIRTEAWLDDKRQYELQLDWDEAFPASPSHVVARDSEGKTLEEWQLTAADASAGVPAPADEWANFIIDDSRTNEGPYARAREALSRYDYARAGQILSDALVDRPDQPLLNLLLAWVDEFGGHPATVRTQQRETLARVVRSGAFDLARMVSAQNFPSLSDRDLYDLLLTMPEERRSSANYVELSDLAAALGRPLDALAHIEAAVARTPVESRDELRDRKLDHIAALLRLGRNDEAIRASEDVLSAQRNGISELVRIGDLFGNVGLTERADDYFVRAWQAAGANRAAQADVLKREARWFAGARRWTILLKAAQADPADSRQRDALVKLVVGEMSTADDAIIAGTLARLFPDPALATALRIREAELTPWPPHAAEIAVELFEARQLSVDRFEWLVKTADAGGRYADVIRVLESSLHNGQRLDDAMRLRLVHAYGEVGRASDAARAQSDMKETPPAETPAGTAPSAGPGLGFFNF